MHRAEGIFVFGEKIDFGGEKRILNLLENEQ